MRVSLVLIGYMCLALAGSPLPDVEQKRKEKPEKPREVQSVEEPSDPVDRFGIKWQLAGLTPLDVRDQCVNKSHGCVEGFEDIVWLQEKEPLENYIRRKRLERV